MEFDDRRSVSRDDYNRNHRPSRSRSPSRHHARARSIQPRPNLLLSPIALECLAGDVPSPRLVSNAAIAFLGMPASKKVAEGGYVSLHYIFKAKPSQLCKPKNFEDPQHPAKLIPCYHSPTTLPRRLP